MKKIVVLVSVLCLAFALASCSGGNQDSQGDSAQQNQSSPDIAADAGQAGESAPVSINPSPDKHTWYVKDYTGMNAASVGYYSLGGDRCDAYGSGYLKIIYVANDGTYLDPENDEQLKDWMVTGQSLAPNTEIKLTFDVDSEGEEYDNLVLCQSYESIALAVERVGEGSDSGTVFTEIQPSPDKYTRYVRDYVGMNAASVGYASLGGQYCDRYGQGYVVLTLVADDGTYFDPEDEETMSQYVVTGQNVEPNTAIEMTFSKDADGNEYSNLVDTQSLKDITLNVTRIG